MRLVVGSYALVIPTVGSVSMPTMLLPFLSLLHRPCRLPLGPSFIAVPLFPAFERQGEDVLKRLERVPVYSLGSSRLQEGSFADKAYRAQKV